MEAVLDQIVHEDDWRVEAESTKRKFVGSCLQALGSLNSVFPCMRFGYWRMRPRCIGCARSWMIIVHVISTASLNANFDAAAAALGQVRRGRTHGGDADHATESPEDPGLDSDGA